MFRTQSVLFLLLAGCTHIRPPEPAPPESGGPADCAPACDTLRRLQCSGHQGSPGVDEVYGTPDDVSCTQACIELVNADPTFTLAQRCVAQATSCPLADDCLARSE